MKRILKMRKKTLASILAVVLVFACLPAAVFGAEEKAAPECELPEKAAEENGLPESVSVSGNEEKLPAADEEKEVAVSGAGEEAAGWGADERGTAQYPYRITSLEKLKKYRDIVNGINGETRNAGACAALMADIATDKALEIASGKYPFTGQFEGNHHTVSGCGITFVVNEGTIRNLKLYGEKGKPLPHLVDENNKNVQTICLTGEAQGLVYENKLNGHVYRCCNYATITEKEFTAGLVTNNEGCITECYNAGDVPVDEEGYGGGIVCCNLGGTVEDCYNTGRVYATDTTWGAKGLGGIAGQFTGGWISKCYSINGMICGEYNSGTFDKCFSLYDEGKDGITKLDKSDLADKSIFKNAGWDFDTEKIWTMGASRPKLTENFEHEHVWNVTVSADKSAAKVKCTEAQCPYTTDKEYTICIEAENAEYDMLHIGGYPASVSWSPADLPDCASGITYKGLDGTSDPSGVPEYAGKYRASVKIADEYEIYRDYEIYRKLFSVSFNLSGKPGAVPETQYVEQGARAVEPDPDPETDGFVFDCWCRDKDCKFKYSFNTVVMENKTLYARWLQRTPTQITISTTEGGDPVTVIEKKYPADAGFTLFAKAAVSGNGGVWKWKSSDTKVAKVDNAGRVSINSAGSAIIKVSYASDTTMGSASVSLNVTGEPEPGPGPAPEPTPTPTPTPIPETGFTAAFDKTSVSVNEAGEALLTYTGAAQKPDVIVKNNGKLLHEGTDYTVKYTGNTNFSETGGKVTVTGKGTYSGTKELKIRISKRSLADPGITVGSTVIEKGKAANPVVTYNGAALKKGTDYTAGDVAGGKLTLTGAGNFEGDRDVTVTELEPKEYKKTAIKISMKNNITKVYNGQPQILTDSELTVKNADGNLLKNGTDYMVSYSANVNAGSVKVVVTGINGYSGSTKKNFRIVPAKNSSFEIKKDKTEYGFVRSGVKPVLTVTAVLQGGAKESLVEGKDFNVSYSNNKKIGTGKASVTFKGNYKGAKYTGDETKFSIVPALMTAENTCVIASDMVYKKAAKYQPVPIVTVNGEALAKGDFTTTYSETEKITLENGTVKECTLTVKAKTGNKAKYKDGTKDAGVSATYRVVSGTDKKAVNKAKVSVVKNGKAVKSVEYTGLPITFDDIESADAAKLSMKVGTETLDAKSISENFIISYADNIEKGTGKVILSAKPDSKYIGTVTGNFKISAFVIGTAKK